jgi:hypothetical protein
MTDPADPLTPEVRALIGLKAEKVLACPPWGIEREGLRSFTNAIMDPDPRYWDEAFAETTRYGGIVTPPIYCCYIGYKTPAGMTDPLSKALRNNPNSDGGISLDNSDPRGRLPPIPTPLKRMLNGGTDVEFYQYPKLGDLIYSQASYSDIQGRTGKDGAPMLIYTMDMNYTNQDDALLCILRQSVILR